MTNDLYRSLSLEETKFFDEKEIGFICNICYHRCVLKKGRTGLCGVFRNINDHLHTLRGLPVSVEEVNYAENVNVQFLDPGEKIWVVGLWGCNLKCRHCINFRKSYVNDFNRVKDSIKDQSEVEANFLNSGCDTILFSIAESTIHLIELIPLLQKLRKIAKRIILGTNGLFTQEALNELVKYIDCFRIDVKSFDEKGYRLITNCPQGFTRVKNTIESLTTKQKRFELVFCIVPGVNDEVSQILDFCNWLRRLSVDTPLTLIRFIPSSYFHNYRLSTVEELKKIKDIMRGIGFRYVKIGGT